MLVHIDPATLETYHSWSSAYVWLTYPSLYLRPTQGFLPSVWWSIWRLRLIHVSISSAICRVATESATFALWFATAGTLRVETTGEALAAATLSGAENGLLGMPLTAHLFVWAELRPWRGAGETSVHVGRHSPQSHPLFLSLRFSNVSLKYSLGNLAVGLCHCERQHSLQFWNVIYSDQRSEIDAFMVAYYVLGKWMKYRDVF